MKGTFALLLLLLFGCIQKSEAQCTVVILGNSSTCSGQSTRLIAKVTGGNPTSFTWTSTPAGVYTNNDTIFVSPTAATNYVVTVSGNGCSANDAFSMAILPLPPVPSFTFGPDSVCSGAPVSFSASPTGGGVTFSWNFGDGRTGTGANVSHKFYSYGNGSGSFNVTLTIKGANGCTRSVTQTVKVIQRPHAVFTPAAGTDTLTFDGFVTFYKCITNQQTSAVFNFRNAAVPAGGVNYTILWGDTGVPFTTTTPWATIAHTYGLGIFTITYIVSNPTSGCSDTTYYKAFFGSNPAGGIATLGSTTICGPASLAFILTNYQSNPPGTLYTITFNDSSTSLTFPHPPPDTIFHLFDRTSCGTTSSNGISNFGNAFGAFLIVTNPCGVTSGSVLPIYVSMSPKANFVVSNNFTACVNTDATIINTSINGQAVSNGSCNSTTYLLWNVSPPTGWTLTGGSMGSDNGYIGNNYDPTGWSTGSAGLNVRFTTIGTYQMRLVVANNCGKPDTIIKNVCVSGPPTPSFTLPSNIGCAPYVVIPNNTTPSTGSCSSINYIWNPAFLSATCLPDSLTYFEFVNGTTNQSASPRLRLNNQGLYQLSLTAQNVCGSFTTPVQNITVKDRPELSVDIPAGICGGDHFTASSSALACGSTISGYSWTFQGGTPATASVQNPGNISMTTPGFHLVSVSATSECGVMRIDTSIVVDTIPQAKPGADTSVCGGLPIRIGATLIPGYIYAWSPSLGLDDTTVSAPTANLTNNSDTVFRQTYMLIAGVTGCKDTASVVVSIYPPALANAGGAYSVCSGDSVVLNGSISGGATSALWTSLDGIFRPTDSLTTHFTPSIISGSTTVTLTSNDPVGPCPAVVANSSVTINELPLVSNSPLSQTVCSGAVSQTVILTSSIPGTTYTWTASSSDGVTGFIANGTTDSIPSQFFTNSSDSSGHVVYVITPSFGNCTGPVANYVFTISPVPDVILPAPQTICSGASFNMVSLTSSTIGTTFSWTSATGNNLTGNTLSGNGDIPGQTLTNAGSDTGTVLYTVTPLANGCPGTVAIYPVIVNPVPDVIFSPAPQNICSGQTSQLVTLSSSTPNVTIQWTAIIPNSISNDSTGTVTIAPQTLVNTTNQPLTITYSAQATTSGATLCPGIPVDYSISVIPIPEIDFNLSINNGCTPLIVTFEPVIQKMGVPDSITFSWDDGSASTVIYPNQTAPIWNTTRHTFYNNSNQPDTFFVALVAKNQCIDTAVIKPVMLSPNLINAFFTALPTTGCEPLSVTLQDLSTGAVGLSWCFDFDQTTNACIGGSAVNIAGAGFQQTFAAGIHTIALYATNGYGCARDTAFQTINVSPAPVADFVSASGLCAEVPVAFTDQTIAPSGSFVSAYRWQFGDGDSAIIRDPVHTYPTVGNYSVCLEVVSAFGCYDSICKEVVILSKPEVGFSSFDTCLNTPPIAFTNLSNGATFYDWSFGDGNTSALPSPVHSYSNSGTFTVQLIGFTQSCSDTAQHNVTIYPVPKPSFNLPSVYSCGVPSSIVLNNTTTGANNFAWDFDNNATSTLTNPIAIYSSSGQYNITLTASNSFGCFDTAKRLIDIYPFPDIHSVEVQPSSGCDPVNALFTVNASNANQFVWDFSDGSSFTTLSSTISHRFDGPGYYSVLLKVYSFNDCGDTLFMQDTVHVYVIPTARFGYAMNDNVEPYNGTVVFTNQSENASNYFWDFGDGSNSNVTSPSHIFPSVNQFEVMLISSSAYGCSDTMIKRIDIIKKSLFVPNILAPDFSAGNDMTRRWKPVGSGLKEYRAQIFNQWGELLWESSAIDADFNVAEGWDGTYRGQICQQDVYVWKIEAVFLDGTRWEGMNYEKGAPRKTIGTVTLVR